MSDIAIRVEGLSKQYRLGARERYRTLRDTLTDTLAAPFRLLRANGSSNGERKSEDETIWALKDVSFEVKHGEVIGIIGRNGAGKSTLLKILSRITEPTEGHAEIHGRVGSLLEVGTGFHPELTGRENIFLNGAILGMKKAEIERKFDQIVDFAEIEGFIDTAVKHYSSGMYVRLAFAVAAHMETEILLVDEVLAVGDHQFQQKCLAKVGDLASAGRTVLFISHNMNAVSMLCTGGMALHKGRMIYRGAVEKATECYLTTLDGNEGSIRARVEFARSGTAPVSLRAISVTNVNGHLRSDFGSRDPILIQLELDIERPSPDLCIGYDLRQIGGDVVFRSYQNDALPHQWPELRSGRLKLTCKIPAGILNGGKYLISPRISYHCKGWLVHLDDVLSFEVALNHSASPFWAVLDGRNRPGSVAPVLEWSLSETYGDPCLIALADEVRPEAVVRPAALNG